jgi:hypothetical protein
VPTRQPARVPLVTTGTFFRAPVITVLAQ